MPGDRRAFSSQSWKTSSQPNGPAAITMNEAKRMSVSTGPDVSGSKPQKASKAAPAKVAQLAAATVVLLTRSLEAGPAAGPRAAGPRAARRADQR